MANAKQTFAPLPARAIGDEKLSALDLRVLAALAAHDRLGANGIGCYASHPRLAALVGCHEKSLSRSLATLAGTGGGETYIEAARHPINARLRVYKVIYTDFDKQFLGQSIGNETATIRRRRKGNEAATEKGGIGNRLVPQQVTGPNEVPEQNQKHGSVNIFSETGIHPVETGKISGETASSVRENDRNDVPEEPAQALRKGAPSVSVGAMLAMIERGIQASNWKNSRVWLRYLEDRVGENGDLDANDPNHGRALRLLETYGDELERGAA